MSGSGRTHKWKSSKDPWTDTKPSLFSIGSKGDIQLSRDQIGSLDDERLMSVFQRGHAAERLWASYELAARQNRTDGAKQPTSASLKLQKGGRQSVHTRSK